MNTYQVSAVIHHDDSQPAVFLFGVEARTWELARATAYTRVEGLNVGALAVAPIREENDVSDAHA